MTPPEVRLWCRLRPRQPGKPVFRRQHPVGPFILDFYCAKARLAIEVDGWGHNMGEPNRDRRRTEWLEAQGIEVVRYNAVSVMRNIDEVSASILNLARQRIGAAACPPP